MDLSGWCDVCGYPIRLGVQFYGNAATGRMVCRRCQLKQIERKKQKKQQKQEKGA